MHELPLDARHAVERSHRGPTNNGQQRDVVGIEPVQPVGDRTEQTGIESTQLLISEQRCFGADVFAASSCAFHHIGQGRDIANTDVQTLPGKRVNDMGRIADERSSLDNEPLGDRQAQRKDRSVAGERTFAEQPAQFRLQACKICFIAEGLDLPCSLFLFRPVDGGCDCPSLEEWRGGQSGGKTGRQLPDAKVHG